MLKLILFLLISFLFIQLKLTLSAFAGAFLVIGGDSTYSGGCHPEGANGLCSYTVNHGGKHYGGEQKPSVF